MSPGEESVRSHVSGFVTGGEEVKKIRAAKPAAPGFVVLRRVGEDEWEFLGEVPRKRGLPARAARTQAILDATSGTARDGEVYPLCFAANGGWRMDWGPGL
jgi:hypothetical protein